MAGFNMRQKSGREFEQEEEETYPVSPPRKTFTEQDLSRMSDRRQVLQERLRDPDYKKVFRHAYFFKAGYDFSSLKPYCERLVMVTDGWSDHINNTRQKIEEGLADYDSDKDVIVIAGRSIDHLLVGQIVAGKVAQKPKAKQSYAVAVYLNPNYIFYQTYLDPAIEAHEIITK